MLVHGCGRAETWCFRKGMRFLADGDVLDVGKVV